MHEASLVQGLLQLVLSTVQDANARAEPFQKICRVREIICDLGLFSCVEPQTLTSCFELFAEGTLAEGAELTLRTQPL
ncbi:MAG: hydrogenase maturation nickel metallochaperone HypA, partial [Desulfovibrionaceae bacterium]|nr:hydrogenase maturation nickel metallochaperone HypA [Desulfovibrionaceae bacterium]